VKDDSAGFGFKAHQVPLEGGDFSSATSALLEQMNHALADEGLKGIRGCPDEEADDGSGNEKRD
jgi:hypothetical protein